MNKIYYLKNKKRTFNKIIGTNIKPRLSVFKSNKHLYTQVINDRESHTLISYNTLKFRKELKFSLKKITKKVLFYSIGRQLAKKAKKKIITKIVFDRQKYSYHGNIKLLAEGARDYGLIF